MQKTENHNSATFKFDIPLQLAAGFFINPSVMGGKICLKEGFPTSLPVGRQAGMTEL